MTSSPPGSERILFLFLEVLLGDDAFQLLVCPRVILRARTPIGVLPEWDATSWASEGPHVFVDVLEQIGLVFVFLVHVLFIEEAVNFVRHPALCHDHG